MLSELFSTTTATSLAINEREAPSARYDKQANTVKPGIL